MRTGLLLGREHQLLGGVAAIAEGSCAIALSLGGAKKVYEHRDPNEDAAISQVEFVVEVHEAEAAASVANIRMYAED
jgi:hypothetical protein